MLLNSRDEVLELLEAFDVTSDGDLGIDDFFRDHQVNPVGVIQYGAILTNAAAFSNATDDPVKALLVLFSAGVALGLKLAEMAAENGEVIDLDSKR